MKKLWICLLLVNMQLYSSQQESHVYTSTRMGNKMIAIMSLSHLKSCIEHVDSIVQESQEHMVFEQNYININAQNMRANKEYVDKIENSRYVQDWTCYLQHNPWFARWQIEDDRFFTPHIKHYCLQLDSLQKEISRMDLHIDRLKKSGAPYSNLLQTRQSLEMKSTDEKNSLAYMIQQSMNNHIAMMKRKIDDQIHLENEALYYYQLHFDQYQQFQSTSLFYNDAWLKKSAIINQVKSRVQPRRLLMSERAVNIPAQQVIVNQELAQEELTGAIHMQQIQQEQEVQQRVKDTQAAQLLKQEALIFKNNLSASIIDLIFDKVFLHVDKNKQIQLDIEQMKLKEAIGNKKMVYEILMSVIDRSANIAETRIVKKLEDEKFAANVAKNKELQQQALQIKKDREIAEKERIEKERKEFEALLATQALQQKLMKNQGLADAQSVVQISKEEVVALEHVVVNRKNIAAKVIDHEKRMQDRLAYLQNLIKKGLKGDVLKSCMAGYDVFLKKHDAISVSQSLLDFQKMLKISVLDDESSYESFIDIINCLHDNAQDIDISEDDKIILHDKITLLFEYLYTQYADSHLHDIEKEKEKNCDYLIKLEQSRIGASRALKQAKNSHDAARIQKDLQFLEESFDKASRLYEQNRKASSLLDIMIRLRKLQIFGGVFQFETTLSSSHDTYSLSMDKFYETDLFWKQQLQDYENFAQSLMHKKPLIKTLDYSDCKEFLVDQYNKLNVPSDAVQLIVFDAVYSITNMLDRNINCDNELDMQRKLFSYLCHAYPLYSLDLIDKMTKSQLILFKIMKNIKVT